MIEFKEGAVCYANGHQWKVGDKISSLHGLKVIDHDDFLYLAESVDFELNEPREGWYIPKSELDTEEKYNKAVEVFGLFGFEFMIKPSFDGHIKYYDSDDKIAVFNGMLVYSHDKEVVKASFAQLMTIGELKRKMDERDEKFESDFNKAMQAERSDENINSQMDEPQFGKNEDGSMKLLKSNFLEKPNSSEQVKNPSHYQLMDGIESIEIIARSMTQEQWKGFCLGNMLKYRIRAGKKDKLQQDINKANFYGELYEMHKGKCYE